MRGNFALCPTRAAASCASDGASSRIDTMAADTVPTIEAERDARALHGAEDGGHRIDPAEIAIGVINGRTSEFFDLFVHAIDSVLVFPKLVDRTRVEWGKGVSVRVTQGGSRILK